MNGKKIEYPTYEAMAEAREKFEKEGRVLTTYCNHERKEYWLELYETKGIASRNKILQELDFETEHYSPHTRSQYFSHVQDYLDYVGSDDWRDRDVLRRYLQKLKAKGKSQSHINYIVRGPIGAVFRAHDVKIPVKLPRVKVARYDYSDRVSFSVEEVVKLIKAALASGNKQWQNIIAIATTYGPRASEIRAIRQEDAHPIKKTLVIHTLKEGFKREHLVPPQIQPYVFNYDYSPVSSNGLYLIFKDIAKAAGIVMESRKVYHAIRHRLDNELRHTGKVRQIAIAVFFGWAEGGMVDDYANPYQPDIDAEVFVGHPFLKYWG